MHQSIRYKKRAWRWDRRPTGVAVDAAAGAALGVRYVDPLRAGPDLPFPAYVESLVSVPAGEEVKRRVQPRFCGGAKSRRGAISLVEVLGLEGCSLYGTGEQAGPLLRNGTIKTLWNNDHFDYTDKSANLYQSHPYVMALRADGSAVGVIIETTFRCDIDLRGGGGTDLTGTTGSGAGARMRVLVHGPSPAVVIIEERSPQALLAVLHRLTGNIAMPPRWALGYHQCRWSYQPAEKFLELAQEFRSRGIPCDCLWFDIDYMDGFRCFTVDEHKFPDARALNAQLVEDGFRTIYMIDCGIKADDAYSVYREGKEAQYYITTSDGLEYHGEVWPGACAFPDFTSERVRAWWASLYKEFMALGIDGVWNDMNEPAVFKGVQKTMPISNLHRPDLAISGALNDCSHARYHNLYGMLMSRATHEGITAANPHKRPFVLTRSNFLGGQRYAATWTGDNRSDWNHLRWSISMALNLSLSGQPFVGPDIGGFIGNATGPLFARWMGIGALLPFARAHSEKTTLPHEPWSFGPECEKTCRLALMRRYRLLPYIYTLFWRAATLGETVVAPVFFADSKNKALRAVDDSFLLGPDLLVQCSVSPTATARPDPMIGGWKPITILESDQDRHDENMDEDLPRLFLRPGAALPLGPARQFTSQAGLDERLELIIHQNEDGIAETEVYQDANDGFGFQRGEMAVTKLRVDRTLKLIKQTRGDAAFAAAVRGVRY